MRFVGLQYRDEARWARLTSTQRAQFLARCQSCDDELRMSGYLQEVNCVRSDHETITIRNTNGYASVEEGSITRGNDQLTRIVVLEAFDLNQAIALLSKYPLLWGGAFEVRPVEHDVPGLVSLSSRSIGELP